MSSGLYSLTPFLIGTKLLVSLPLEVSVVAATGALLYVLLGLQVAAAKFWAFMALSVFLAVCAANLGNAICLVMTNMHFKLPALCITATLLLAFAGFVGESVRGNGRGEGTRAYVFVRCSPTASATASCCCLRVTCIACQHKRVATYSSRLRVRRDHSRSFGLKGTIQ
jgi:hypothetical protein